MRERVTYVLPPGSDVEPGAVELQQAGLLGPSTEAVREDRLTIALDELPPELGALLGGYRELHVRWSSPRNYDTLDPFSSRLSPGLHVFFAPSSDGDHDPRLPMLALGSVATGPLSYFYQELEDLSALVSSGTQDICPQLDPICRSRLRSLYTAVSLDMSFDSTARTLRVAAFWPLREHTITVPGSSERRTEVGILCKGSPPNLGSHELGVSGLLGVLGEQKEPSLALFAFPSRHRMSNVSFSSEFLTPTGLHPTLQLRLSSSKAPAEDSGCAPYAYLTLPKTIFADRYQFEDELFLAFKNLTASRYTSLPVDLEAPAYATKPWGSSVLLQLAPPASAEAQAWTVQVPLHLRYLEPSVSGYASIEVPYPAVFWACESGGDVDFSTNPFDRRHLGYDGLFGPGTTFWHVSPKPEAGNRIMSPVSVPVLKEQAAAWVELGTAAAVGLGFAWILWRLLAVLMTSGYGSTRGRTQQQKKAN